MRFVVQVIFERRILLGCTVLVGLSVCIWSIAIGTDHWFTVEAPDEGGLPLGDPSKGRRLIYKHMGLWRGCVEGTMPHSENSTEMIPYSKCMECLKNVIEYYPSAPYFLDTPLKFERTTHFIFILFSHDIGKFGLLWNVENLIKRNCCSIG